MWIPESAEKLCKMSYEIKPTVSTLGCIYMRMCGSSQHSFNNKVPLLYICAMEVMMVDRCAVAVCS